VSSIHCFHSNLCLTKHNPFLIFGACSIVQAVLKIIKHCEEFAPALVTGQLLGLDVGGVLEVTNCFPFPVSDILSSCAFCFCYDTSAPILLVFAIIQVLPF
jgi:hypothetical protein